MNPTIRSLWLVPALSLAALSTACSSDDKTPEPPVCERSCSTAENCLGDDVCENGCCVAPPPQCTTTADCCPGQTCSVTRQCRDTATMCLTDADCGNSGDLYCLENGVCGKKACSFDGSCPEPWQSCFAGVCVANVPCSGGCGDGAACVLASGTCYPAVDYCGDKATSVPVGYMAVFNDLSNVYGACNKKTLSCDVYELPDVVVSDLGRHASLDTAEDGTVVASMYDGTHGDLVVRTFDADGNAVSTQWVDGVPADAPVMGSLKGPRGGIAENGDDVGTHTSLKVQKSGAGAGSVHVAYYAKTGASLRYVHRDADGSWGTPHVVDGGEAVGDVGMYADLSLVTVDGEPRPAIAYFQKSAGTGVTCGDVKATDGGSTASRMTALKFAMAKKAVPASPEDWTVETVACHVMPEPACEQCPLECVVDETSFNGARCVSVTTDCVDASGAKTCTSSQHCVDGACHEKATYEAALTNFTMGKGLFPSLAFAGGGDVPYVAWYDSAAGNLVLSSKKNGAWSHRVVDGEKDGKDTGDTGLYPAIAFDLQRGGAPVIAYHDATRKGLRIATGATLDAVAVADQESPADADFIDRGYVKGAARYVPPARVGADVRLLATESGLYAAYQDMTSADLVLRGRQADGTWKELARWSEGSTGYYAGLGGTRDKLFLGTARLKMKTMREKPRVANEYNLFTHVPSNK